MQFLGTEFFFSRFWLFVLFFSFYVFSFSYAVYGKLAFLNKKGLTSGGKKCTMEKN